MGERDTYDQYIHVLQATKAVGRPGIKASTATCKLLVYFISCIALAGNVINLHTGQWTGRMSGVGAGIDSYYEYLLKVRYCTIDRKNY